MKAEYIILGVVYGSVIIFTSSVAAFLTFKSIRKWFEKRKVEQKRKHLRVIK